MKRGIVFFLAALLGVGSGVALAMGFMVTDVSDNSMMPSYTQGDKILVGRQVYRNDSPERGDVILFPNQIYSSTGENGLMMKRVIGLPEDQVMLTGGQVYVNNRVLEEEDYIFSAGISGEMEQVTVPAGKVFVLGDNRATSTDSRSETVGFVDADAILGKVIFQW